MFVEKIFINYEKIIIVYGLSFAPTKPGLSSVAIPLIHRLLYMKLESIAANWRRSIDYPFNSHCLNSQVISSK